MVSEEIVDDGFGPGHEQAIGRTTRALAHHALERGCDERHRMEMRDYYRAG
jgi:hypothetical protein